VEALKRLAQGARGSPSFRLAVGDDETDSHTELTNLPDLNYIAFATDPDSPGGSLCKCRR
jgi:hypothetical protein